MSALNQSGDDQLECPLCMEPFEVDDLNFYPCTCGYQICRFCWHRIRTDENGLCPACRKAYTENPAGFTPLSKEQVSQMKAEKRQRDQQRKAKLSESRKHLSSVRVVQRNLVFVVGLPMRLADPEVLKKYEYFGKFGKIHKVVINQSTAYAGTQGPSASAYVTYVKSDDALKAIQNVNNTIMDGKTIKTSLGTTKYCSHFMKNQPCPKPDCMYLHDFGDQEASFTKEQMHVGKHQEYEKKLHDALLIKQQQQQALNLTTTNTSTSNNPNPTQAASSSSTTSTSPTSNVLTTSSSSSSSSSSSTSSSTSENNTNKKQHSNNKSSSSSGNWPQLEKNNNTVLVDGNNISKRERGGEKDGKQSSKNKKVSGSNSAAGGNNNSSNSSSKSKDKMISAGDSKKSSRESLNLESGSGNNSNGSSESKVGAELKQILQQQSQQQQQLQQQQHQQLQQQQQLLQQDEDGILESDHTNFSSSSTNEEDLTKNLIDDNSSFFSANCFGLSSGEKYNNDTYKNDKYNNDTYNNDKYNNDKYSNEKYSNDKCSSDKYNTEKYDKFNTELQFTTDKYNEQYGGDKLFSKGDNKHGRDNEEPSNNSCSIPNVVNNISGGGSSSNNLLLLNHHHQHLVDPLLQLNNGDTDSWEFDFGYTKHSNHLEELAKQRLPASSHSSANKDVLLADSLRNGFVGPLVDSYSLKNVVKTNEQNSSAMPFLMDPFIGGHQNNTTENLLEALAKNSVNYQHQQQQQQQQHSQQYPPPHVNGLYLNGHKDGLINATDQYSTSKFFSDFYRNHLHQQQPPQQQHQQPPPHQQQQQQQQQPQLHNGLLNSLENNKYLYHQHQQHQQQHQQQVPPPPLTQNNSNGGGQLDRFLYQQQRLEEQLRNWNLNKQQQHNGPLLQQQPQQPPPHFPTTQQQSNYDTHNGLTPQQQHLGAGGSNFGLILGNSSYDSIGSAMAGGGGVGGMGKGPVLEDSELDYRFQQAQKALEELVESDGHNMHNNSRSNPSSANNSLVGSNLNGLVSMQHQQQHLGTVGQGGQQQQQTHLPPPPPGFVQPNNAHMNSFGSKILPFLNMNSQQHQQQQQQQIGNSWPNSYNINSQLQQHNKGINVCNDWKFLDPAILSSRRHMGTLLDQYNSGPPGSASTPQASLVAAQQQQQMQATAPARYDHLTSYSSNTASTSLPSQQHPQQQQQAAVATQQSTSSSPYNNTYAPHLNSSQLNSWLGSELSSQISTPPGFRASGQATKQQQEC